jgi:hypothetical protein
MPVPEKEERESSGKAIARWFDQIEMDDVSLVSDIGIGW